MAISPPRPIVLWLMLGSRLALFALMQGIIAAILALASVPQPWVESARWWMFGVAAANTVSIALLVALLRREGRRYSDLWRFQRATFWPDLGLALLGFALAGPIASIPMQALGKLLMGSYEAAVAVMFRPIPLWAVGVGLLFPLTIGLAELPTYFGYVMPRLESHLSHGWLAWGLASLALSLQHLALPLVFDGGFIAWRALMYLPFALYIGLIIKWRPRLLPYLMIGHGLIDLATVAVYLM